jgi:hypothetical protein
MGRACGTHGDMKHVCTFLVRRNRGKRQHVKPEFTWEDNIHLYPRKVATSSRPIHTASYQMDTGDSGGKAAGA